MVASYWNNEIIGGLYARFWKGWLPARSDRLIPEAQNHAEESSGLVAVSQVTMKVGEASGRVVDQ